MTGIKLKHFIKKEVSTTRIPLKLFIKLQVGVRQFRDKVKQYRDEEDREGKCVELHRIYVDRRTVHILKGPRYIMPWQQS